MLLYAVGVATAFAARDVLGNMLSGFSLQFSRPFSVGEYIKVPSYIRDHFFWTHLLEPRINCTYYEVQNFIDFGTVDKIFIYFS